MVATDLGANGSGRERASQPGLVCAGRLAPSPTRLARSCPLVALENVVRAASKGGGYIMIMMGSQWQ